MIRVGPASSAFTHLAYSVQATRDSVMVNSNMGDPHPVFKSVVPTVSIHGVMKDTLSAVIPHQSIFTKKTFPGEMKDWNYKDLQTFKINLNFVDRLYYIYFNLLDEDLFHVICRMMYKNEHVFVQLYARCCGDGGFGCCGRGTILLTRNPNLLFHVILGNDTFDRDAILKLLTSDGYQIDDDNTQPSSLGVEKVKDPHTLQFLTYDAIYKHHHLLRIKDMPPNLSGSLHKFINIREALQFYNKTLFLF